MTRVLLIVLALAGCKPVFLRDMGQPPISALAICDEKPAPKGCEP
jgi:hypothetical protein